MMDCFCWMRVGWACSTVGVIAFCGGVTLAQDTDTDTSAATEQARQLEATAYDALTKTISGAQYEANLLKKSEKSQMEVETTNTFDDKQRMRLMYQYRFQRGSDPSFSAWQGPTYVILKEDLVLSRRGMWGHQGYIDKQSTSGNIHLSKNAYWPQFVGTSLGGVWEMPHLGPRGFWTDRNRPVKKITDESLNGLDTKRVDYDRSGLEAMWMSVWYSPSQNGLIVKMFGQNQTVQGNLNAVEAGAKNNSREVNTKLREWEPGVWFPEESVSVTTVNGSEQDRETFRVTKFELLEPSDEMFDLEGLGLPIGGVVIDNTTGNGSVQKRITKTGLVDMAEGEQAEILVLPRREPSPEVRDSERRKTPITTGTPWWQSKTTMVVLVNCLIALIVVLVLWQRSRS